MIHRHAARIIPHTASHGASVGNQKLTLRVVILMITLASREQKRTLEIPARASSKFKSCSGQKSLGKGVLRVLHSPRSQILSQGGDGQASAKPALQPDIRRSVEISIE